MWSMAQVTCVPSSVGVSTMESLASISPEESSKRSWKSTRSAVEPVTVREPVPRGPSLCQDQRIPAPGSPSKDHSAWGSRSLVHADHSGQVDRSSTTAWTAKGGAGIRAERSTRACPDRAMPPPKNRRRRAANRPSSTFRRVFIATA